MGTNRSNSPSGTQRNYQTSLPIDEPLESNANKFPEDIMVSNGEPSQVTPFLIYLVIIATIGPLQFGFHLVSQATQHI